MTVPKESRPSSPHAPWIAAGYTAVQLETTSPQKPFKLSANVTKIMPTAHQSGEEPEAKWWHVIL